MYKLDLFVVNLALAEARRYIVLGIAPADAAVLACRGAWQELVPQVLAALESENEDRSAGPVEVPAVPRGTGPI